MENKNRTSKLLPVITLLATAGAAISLWQTRLFFMTRSGLGEMKSFCNIGQTFDCTAIEMSKYAEFIPGFPLSAFASAGYLLILILALFGFSEAYKKNIRTYLTAFTGIALLFSLIYLAIMLTQIGKLCLLCLTVDALNVVLFAVALRLPKFEKSGQGFTFSHLVGSGVSALVIALIFSHGMNPQAEMKQDDFNDIIASVMNAPANPITLPADAPSIGDPQAPITVVKFSDYECPACRMGASSIHPLFKRYAKEVRFVFMNFPLAMECNADTNLKRTIHNFACEAATVAVCATEQGKFQEAYETLFENQKDFEGGKIAELVVTKVPGMNLEKLKSCMALPSTREKIRADSQVGVSLKIQSTPTFFINGKKVEGGLPTNLWIEIIDRMLKK
jgi:protein-disulfide isomerase/uncharacterized membrane protein